MKALAIYTPPPKTPAKSTKASRSGFKEFIQQQRQLKSTSPTNPADLFEIRLPSALETSPDPFTCPDGKTVTLLCGEGAEIGEIINVSLDSLLGCSKWFYELFLGGASLLFQMCM